MQPQKIARFDDFSAGHWGAVGARGSKPQAWGGKNVALTRDGRLAPVSASRKITFDNLGAGQILANHWAWGVDGQVYILQKLPGLTTAQLRRFPLNFDGATHLSDIGTPIQAPTRAPDWTEFGGFIYLSLYGAKTYKIDPVGPSMSILTAAPGNAPGGRSLISHGERLMIGGVSDGRFGSHGNRVCYSEPGDVGNFPDDNFFDVGAANTEIGGLYALNDTLVIVLSDQQIWTFRGVPGGVSNLRRAYGFHAGAGGTHGFDPSDGAVDPSQVRLWIYDHGTRGPARFSGTQYVRVPGFGVPTSLRETVTDQTGGIAAIGGPDEVFVDQVPMPRTEGNSAAGDNLELVRLNGAFAVIERSVLDGSS